MEWRTDFTERVLTHVHIHDPADTTPGSGTSEELAQEAVAGLQPAVVGAVLAKDVINDAFARGLKQERYGGVEFFCGYEVQQDQTPLLRPTTADLSRTHVLHCHPLGLNTVVHPNYFGEFPGAFLTPTPVREVTTVGGKRLRLNSLEVMNLRYPSKITEADVNACIAKGNRFLLTAGDDNFFRPKDVLNPHYSHIKIPRGAGRSRASIVDAITGEAFIASQHPDIDFSTTSSPALCTYTSSVPGDWTLYTQVSPMGITTTHTSSLVVSVGGVGSFFRVVYRRDGRKTWFQTVYPSRASL